VLAGLFGSKSVRARLEDLEATTIKLRAEVKAIQGEWESTYQKLHNLRVSLNAKLKASEKLEDAPQSTIAVPVKETPVEPDSAVLRRVFGRK